jgi:hypothetical protein
MFTQFKPSHLLPFLIIPVLYCSAGCRSGGSSSTKSLNSDTTGGTGGSSPDTEYIRSTVPTRTGTGTSATHPALANKRLNDSTGGSSPDTATVSLKKKG